MPKSSSDKLKLALDEIVKLSPNYLCKSVHGDFLKCNCIPKFQDKFAQSKDFLSRRSRIFGVSPLTSIIGFMMLLLGHFWQNFYVLVMFPRMKKPDTFSPLDEKILKSVWQL